MNTATGRVYPTDELLALLLRRETYAWRNWQDKDTEQLIAEADVHGVTSLLYHALRSRSTCWNECPGLLSRLLRNRAHAAAAAELRRRQEMVKLLALLASAGVHPLILKGTALAYSHYAEPNLRSRIDTDLLIHPAEKNTAADVLAGLGYELQLGTTGTLVSTQGCYAKQTPDGQWHVVDLHWRVNNSALLARAFEHQWLIARSVPLPALGASARGLGTADALLLACVHRAGHVNSPFHPGTIVHTGGDVLIWLYDIHLLATALPESEWATWTAQVIEKGMSRICLDAFDRVERAFHTTFQKSTLIALASDSRAQPASVFLVPGRWTIAWAEIRGLPSWRDRGVLLKEIFFPPADYMFRKYSTRRRWLLPFLYLLRIFRGGYDRLCAPYMRGPSET